jgi:DNA invertase Pin-like site-specific DNA recombinase
MAGKRFVAWVAVSSEEQAERYSPQEQLQLARAQVDKHGGTIVAELSVSESRSIVLFSEACERIPAYAELHELIKRRAFDVLICYDATRLGRKTSLIMSVVELCAENNIAIFEIDNPPASLEPDRSYDRRLMWLLKAGGSQQEVEKLKARLAYGRIGKVKAGGLPGRAPPYGYTFRYAADGTRHIDVVPEEAEIVQEIFSDYLDGRGMNTIAANLEARGVPSPGVATWRTSGVNSIIRRAWTYAGVSRLAPRGKLLAEGRGNWEPIITVTTAERSIAERADRRAHRRKMNTGGRLSGIVWCVECQRAMRQVLNEDGSIFDAYDKRRKTPNRRRAVFYCYTYHPGGSVGTNKVIAALEIALDDLAGSDLSAIADDDTSHADRLQAQIAQHDAAIVRHTVALRRADTAYVNGAMDDERYTEQVKRLQAAIAAEREEIIKLHAMLTSEAERGTRRERLEEIRANGHAMLTTPDTARANAWWRRYVRVWARDNEVWDVQWL